MSLPACAGDGGYRSAHWSISVLLNSPVSRCLRRPPRLCKCPCLCFLWPCTLPPPHPSTCASCACLQVIEAARGATLLVHEATFESEMQEEAVRKKHSTTAEALQVATEVGVHTCRERATDL